MELHKLTFYPVFEEHFVFIHIYEDDQTDTYFFNFLGPQNKWTLARTSLLLIAIGIMRKKITHDYGIGTSSG